jgi:superfamily I DNA/RNA helicase
MCRKNIQFTVQSIDSVKGLEADTCVIILTPNLLNYLFKNKPKPVEHFNKEWRKIYVALTRTKQRLVLALDHKLITESEIEVIKKSIESLGFISHN